MQNEGFISPGRRRQGKQTPVERTVAKIRDTSREKIELIEIEKGEAYELRRFASEEKTQTIRLSGVDVANLAIALLDLIPVDWVAIKTRISIVKRKEKDSAATGTEC